ncbi:hypothetical protein IAT40_007761 [Kwoniella sp. CBS 6097]
MAASTSSFSLSSTPPSDSEIWGSNLGSRSASSPVESPLKEGDTSLRRRNGGSTPRLTSSISAPILPGQDYRQGSSSASASASASVSGSRQSSIPPPNLKSTSHPLAQVGPTPPTHHVDVLGDVSRPSLHRLTSETERQVAESSKSGSEYTGSMRGSLDLLRMSTVDEQSSGGEVEVLIHTIKPNQSLAGIALLYGIDLATLRKVNKLWTSDPIHLRTHLYVPLEACKWNKASEVLMRGPGEGQVTLYPKNKAREAGTTSNRTDKGKGKEVQHEHDLPNGYFQSSSDLNHDGQVHGIIDISDDNDNPWFANPSTSISTPNLNNTAQHKDTNTSHPPIPPYPSSTQSHSESRNRSRSTSAAAQFLPSTNVAYDTSSHHNSQIPSDLLGSSLGTLESSSTSISGSSLEPRPRVLDVVRIPSSQLRFFPKRKPPDPQSHADSPMDAPKPTLSRAAHSIDRVNGRRDSIDNDEAKSPLLARAIDAIRRNSDVESNFASAFGEGPSIVNDLSTLPRPLRGHDNSQEGMGPGSPPRASVKTRAKTTVVRLRPPQPTAPLNSSNTFANRLSSLFTVPPPPPLQPPSAPHAKGRIPSSTSSPAIGMGTPASGLPRNGRSTPTSGSAANSRATSRSSTPTLKAREESMELVPRLNDLRVGMGSFGVHFGKGGLGISFPSAPAHSANTNPASASGPYRSPEANSISTFGGSKAGSNGLKKKESVKRKED